MITLKKKNLGIGDPDSFPLEIKGIQNLGNSGDPRHCTRYEKKYMIPYQYFYIIPMVAYCQYKFYHKF